MSIQSPLDLARAEYETATAALKLARDRVTKARREFERLLGKARTPEQVQASRLSHRRAQVLRTHPKLRAITNRARRREAVDALLAERDRPRVWRFHLDDMRFDRVSNTRVIYRKNPARFKLYVAGLTLAARVLRERAGRAQTITGGFAKPRQQDVDNARTLELHLAGLVDASPREVSIHYPSEWRVISSALRPEGSNPRSKGAQRLLALYQHIVRTHTVED